MSDTDWNFDELLEELPEEQAQQLRDAKTAILAGLDQMRSQMRSQPIMPWNAVSWKRMAVLAERLAVETVDYTAEEGLLVGSWMAASSRTQLVQRQSS